MCCLMARLTLRLAEHFLPSYWLFGKVLVSGWTNLRINMPLLWNVFSQLKAFALIVLQVYTFKVNLYLAMNCYLFDVQINFCYTYENSQFDLVEFGPLNMIDPHILSRISRTLQGISLQDVPKNWCLKVDKDEEPTIWNLETKLCVLYISWFLNNHIISNWSRFLNYRWHFGLFYT